MMACVAGASPAVVLPQLEQSAVLMIYIVPRQRRCECRRRPCVCRRTTDGLEVQGDLHRLESRASQGLYGDGWTVSQQAGRRAEGTWRGLLRFFPHGADAENAEAVVAFDSAQSRIATLRDCHIDFGHEWRFYASGSGETWPVVQGNRPQLYITLSGTMESGRSREETVRGVFAVTGSLNDDGDFRGALVCRIPDPAGRILRGREVPTLDAMRLPESGTVFLLMRAVSDANAMAQPSCSGNLIASTNGELRAAEYLFATGNESVALHSALVLGQPMGHLAADITVEPHPKHGQARLKGGRVLTFQRGSGQAWGTVSASIDGGTAQSVILPGATEVDAFCYAGCGPITRGTGSFEGVEGMLSVAGSMTAEPGAISETALLTVFDSTWPLQAKLRSDDKIADSPRGLGCFRPLVNRMDELAPLHEKWRKSLERFAAPIAAAIAARYHSIRQLPDFEGIGFNEALLRSTFERGAQPFRPHAFEGFLGPAVGFHKTYTEDTGQLVSENRLHSYWDRATYHFGERRCKFITGSLADYVPPGEVRDFSSQRLDAIINSYRKDVGVVSYVRAFTNATSDGSHEQTSVGYPLTGPGELLWFGRDLSLGHAPAPANLFTTSHEWRDRLGDKTRFLMVGMFWRVDLEKGLLEPANNLIWRALYKELSPAGDGPEEKRNVP